MVPPAPRSGVGCNLSVVLVQLRAKQEQGGDAAGGVEDVGDLVHRQPAAEDRPPR